MRVVREHSFAFNQSTTSARRPRGQESLSDEELMGMFLAASSGGADCCPNRRLPTVAHFEAAVCSECKKFHCTGCGGGCATATGAVSASYRRKEHWEV